MVQSHTGIREISSRRVSLGGKVRQALHKIPGYLEWRLSRNFHLSPWNFTTGSRQIEVLAAADWIEKIRQDKGQGELTGVDREGRYEAAFCDMFVSQLSASSVLLDVGAGYGLYSVIASHVCPAKNIHCFEPDPVWRWILATNNRKYCNDQLRVFPGFVSSKTKDRSVTLDDYCATHRIIPSMIKMDIEGGEIEALVGMRRICMEYHPIILMEFHLRMLRNEWEADPLDVIRTLESYGYRMSFNGHHWHLVEHAGERDSRWHDTLPNDVNCALLAEPRL